MTGRVVCWCCGEQQAVMTKYGCFVCEDCGRDLGPEEVSPVDVNEVELREVEEVILEPGDEERLLYLRELRERFSS